MQARRVKANDTLTYQGRAYRVSSVANLSRETRIHTPDGTLVFGKDDELDVTRQDRAARPRASRGRV